MLNPTYYAQSSGQGAITSEGACIASITLVAGAGAAAYVDLRDATAADGAKRIRELRIPAGETIHVNFDNLNITNGLYCQAFTGSGAVLYVDAA